MGDESTDDPTPLADADLDMVQRLLSVARRHLGMELSWLSTFRNGDQVFEVLDHGEDSQFQLYGGDRGPLSESYCVRVVDGVLPTVIPDTAENQVTSTLPVTGEVGIGSYVGVPMRSESGDVLGMICAVSGEPMPELNEADARVLELVGLLVSGVLTGESPSERSNREVRDRIESVLVERTFHPQFQPIMSTATGQVLGVEALTRFDAAPQRPDVWFADAASVGLGVELELAAIAAALERLGDFPAGVYMALNASPATINDGGLVRLLSAAQPSRLVVELTEHAAIDDYGELNASLQQLRDIGVRIAIDDVGSGFSSFSHVLQLSPHILKMDVSITRGVHNDPARRVLAGAIVDVASRLGASVVAEGIETEAELQAVRQVGIGYAQGYLIGRPARTPAFELDLPSSPQSNVLPFRDRDAAPSMSLRQFELSFVHSPIGMCLVAIDGRFLQVNPALAAMLGYSTEQLLTKTFQELTDPEDLDLDLQLLEQCLAGSRTSYRIEKRYLRSDGQIMVGDLAVVLVRDDDDTPRFFVSQIVDVTQRRINEELGSARPHPDPLTGFTNRVAAEDRLDEFANGDRSFGVLLAKLIDLPDINRDSGQLAAESALIDTAERVRDAVRRGDTLCRWADDELLLIMPSATHETTDEVARRIRRSLGQANGSGVFDAESFRVDIGIARHEATGSASPREAVDNARRDLRGRNRRVQQPGSHHRSWLPSQ